MLEAFVWAIVAMEVAIPLAFVFWAGRRFERRSARLEAERSIADEAAAWLETKAGRAG